MSQTGPQGIRPPGEPSVATVYAQEKYEKGWPCEETARMSERPSLSGGDQPQTRVSVEPQWVSCRAWPPSTGTRWISGSRLRQFV